MKEWMQIVTGIGAAVVVTLLIALVALVVKLIRLRKSSQRKKELNEKEQLSMVIPWRKGLAMSLTPTLQNGLSTDRLYRWNSDDNLPSKGSMESLSSSTEMLYSGDERRASLLSPDSGASTSAELREIPAYVEEDSAQSLRQTPRIDFDLLYGEPSSTLHVRVVKVTNLPLRYRKNCSSFVKVSLLARRKSSVQTNVIRKTLNPEYEEWFAFPGYSITEVHQYTLRFTVYVKLYGNLKNKFVGDIYYPISKRTLSPGTLVTCTEFISTKKSRSTKVMTGDRGQLFLLLQYQASAGRMKILVRKAENLPKSKSRFLQADHYVIINLIRGDEAVTYSETRAASGQNPVWNQPFLFDIPTNDIDSFRLQFVVMRGRIYSRDGVVGQVIVGPDTTPEGVHHWHQAMLPRAQEVAKWHQIQPL